MNGIRNSTKGLALLSELLLAANGNGASAVSCSLADLTEASCDELLALANSHHVVMRSFPALQQMTSAAGNFQVADWARSSVEAERTRIQRALSFLEGICHALEQAGQVIVI